MKKYTFYFLILIFLTSCGNNKNQIIVKTNSELYNAVKQANEGDKITMANGVWENVQLNFFAEGSENNPILLCAETEGQVFIEGESYIKLGGEYITIEGLYFRNGYTPEDALIEFRINEDTLANHCRITNCVIEDFSKPNRFEGDHWIEFWGRHNELDHCYIAGKVNRGPTVRVFLKGNENIKNYHQIHHNYFGPRPRKGGPRGETMQIGDSYTSMSPSHVQVFDNYFDRCNGEVEIISSKSNFNEFRNNVFFECEGSLVMRHGNYCNIDGNYFIGNDNSDAIGGIRVINTGHQITNNYFYKLKGEEFRSPLAVMNGIPKSPLNRYNQVTDVVVAFNTWVDCKSPWQFSVGANMNKSDVLPKTEIRSARPERVLIANNIIFNNKADKNPIKTYDKVDGITFKNNIIDNQGEKLKEYTGINEQSLAFEKHSDAIYLPSKDSKSFLSDVFMGFEFDKIDNDITGADRLNENNTGAFLLPFNKELNITNKDKYGPQWYVKTTNAKVPNIIKVSSAIGELNEKVQNAQKGDIFELTDSLYEISSSILLDKNLSIRSANGKKVYIVYTGKTETPLFKLFPKTTLYLEGVNISGDNTQYAFAPLKEGKAGNYNLFVKNTEIDKFYSVLHAYKGSFADTISFDSSKIKNCAKGIVLAAETDDKGDYNAEFVFFKNTVFENVESDIINFYRGGYDESTIGGNLLVDECSFTKCGKGEDSKILLKTRGIINVLISNSTFENNPIKYIAYLWGEKNNKHVKNSVKNSGKIHEELYLKQKIVY